MPELPPRTFMRGRATPQAHTPKEPNRCQAVPIVAVPTRTPGPNQPRPSRPPTRTVGRPRRARAASPLPARSPGCRSAPVWLCSHSSPCSVSICGPRSRSGRPSSRTSTAPRTRIRPTRSTASSRSSTRPASTSIPLSAWRTTRPRRSVARTTPPGLTAPEPCTPTRFAPRTPSTRSSTAPSGSRTTPISSTRTRSTASPHSSTASPTC